VASLNTWDKDDDDDDDDNDDDNDEQAPKFWRWTDNDVYILSCILINTMGWGPNISF